MIEGERRTEERESATVPSTASSTAPASASSWIQSLRTGDQAAATRLWHAYHARLVQLAQNQLGHRLRSEAEDVVARAFAACFQNIQAGRYPDIAHPDDLWRLLLTITLNQARLAARDATRQRRDVRRTTRACDLFELAADDLDRLTGNAPDPSLVAELNETTAELLTSLPDDLSFVAVELLAGWSPIDIAARLACSVRTVERRRERIRQYWLAD